MKNKRLEEAKKYIYAAIQQGYYEPEGFVTMTDDELIVFAEHEMERAQAAYENWKDEHD